MRAYSIVIGSYPTEAIEYLTGKALRDCQFFPSPSECLAILKTWARNDPAFRAKIEAQTAVRLERQARFDDLMRRLERSEVDQTEVDALNERTRRIAFDRGYLRRVPDGGFAVRGARP